MNFFQAFFSLLALAPLLISGFLVIILVQLLTKKYNMWYNKKHGTNHCINCSGTGRVLSSQFGTYLTCPHCNGSGIE